MPLQLDQLEALAECTDLINTGRSAIGEEMSSIEDVLAFCARHRVENSAAAGPDDIGRLRAFRAELDAIAMACGAGDAAAVIAGLNQLLARTGAVPQIVAHDGRGPHIHVSRAGAPVADRIAAHCAMGLAELVVAGQADRLRICASPDCLNLFLDLSRNRIRRYCDSRTCGNRQHVAAYRARRAGAAVIS